MLGINTVAITHTNQLQINIPDELKGIELQLIILPVGKKSEQADFFTNDELETLNTVRLDAPNDDNDDYGKW